MNVPPGLLWALLAGCLLAATASDVRSRRIPDFFTYPVLLLCLGVRFAAQGWGSWETGLVSGAVAAAGAAGLFALFSFRGSRFGWGDVKLAGTVGAALGYPLVVAALLFISLAGAGQAVLTVLWQRFGPPRAEKTPWTRPIPYAVAIAIGSFWAMWWEHSKI